jgi:DNA-binding CsgD family transcriptional regulator
MRTARLPIAQRARNPTLRDREILTLLAEGHTQKEAAGILAAKPRTVTSAVERIRARYTAPTLAALVALAIRLEWIALAIECTGPKDTTDTTAQNH